jgi:nicotinamide-nucleotide amidase
VTGEDAEILAVGSELLTPTKIDTNSLWLTEQLNTLGVEVVGKSIVGDDRVRLTDAVRGAIGRARIVIVTGGLGPTEDDVTRDAVAAALGRQQSFREDLCEAIAARFRLFRRPMAEINKRQAWLIDGAESLPNDRGTAPGQWIEHERGFIALLPGPPRELKAMFEQQIFPRLQSVLPSMAIRTRFYRVACMGESDVDQKIAPVYTKYLNPLTTILAGIADIQLHLRARAATAEEAEVLLEQVGPEIEALLGTSIYSNCGDPLEKVVGSMLAARGKTVAFAESLTGGGFSGRFTSVPGASEYFAGGVVVYTTAAKQELLGIPGTLLEKYSPVSEPVAAALAENVRARLRADYGVSLTGYAGPEGGDELNAIGTVFIGIAGPAGTSVRRLHFAGDRDRIRTLAGVWALDLLRRVLLT